MSDVFYGVAAFLLVVGAFLIAGTLFGVAIGIGASSLALALLFAFVGWLHDDRGEQA